MAEKNEWSPEDLKTLRAIYSVTKDEAVAKKLGRTVAQIEAAAKLYALRKDKRAFPGETTMPRWSPEDIAELKAIYATTPSVEIARRMGRSLKSVNGKALKLGLSKSGPHIQKMGRKNAGVGGSRKRPAGRAARRPSSTKRKSASRSSRSRASKRRVA